MSVIVKRPTQFIARLLHLATALLQASMASSLRSNPTTFFQSQFPIPKHVPSTVFCSVTVRCGPRDNRGPLVKGRTLSTEAIQAIQSLKRAQRSDPNKLQDVLSNTLSRLLKADLVATFKELLRQDQCALALKVFSLVRSEYKADLGLYAELASALSKNGMAEEIDRLVNELDEEGEMECDDKGLIRLIRAVIGGDRKESTVRMYRLMRRSGWGSAVKADDYTVRVFSRGLRRLGEAGVADEIDREFGNLMGTR